MIYWMIDPKIFVPHLSLVLFPFFYTELLSHDVLHSPNFTELLSHDVLHSPNVYDCIGPQVPSHRSLVYFYCIWDIWVYSKIEYDTIQYDNIQYNTVQYDTILRYIEYQDHMAYCTAIYYDYDTSIYYTILYYTRRLYHIAYNDILRIFAIVCLYIFFWRIWMKDSLF